LSSERNIDEVNFAEFAANIQIILHISVNRGKDLGFISEKGAPLGVFVAREMEGTRKGVA
jgi:hypothetical protein